jgi:hypothetical protein
MGKPAKILALNEGCPGILHDLPGRLLEPDCSWSLFHALNRKNRGGF